MCALFYRRKGGKPLSSGFLLRRGHRGFEAQRVSNHMVLTLFVSCWGEGKPLISAVDARSFLRRNGHGLRPPSVAAGARGVSLPPKPPIPSPARFYREKSQEYEAIPPPKTSGVYTACRFAAKARFFRSLRAGRFAAASRFTFFRGETLYANVNSFE